MRTYRLSEPAIADIAEVLTWTAFRFGEGARRRYELLVATALRDLTRDPDLPGRVDRSDLGVAVRSYHLRHSRWRARTDQGIVGRPRHLLLYRSIHPDLIGIGRLLHDAMDLERHVPDRFGDEDE